MDSKKKMKIYLTNELDSDEPVEYTEQQILDEYWDHWSEKMIKRYGENHHLINERNCITDWAVVNWAWEKSKDEA